jgi:two-component system LytT family response regulator
MAASRHSGMIRVVIADDEPLAREGLRDFIADEADMQVVAEARDGDEALAVIDATQPDLVLLDVQMPGLSGTDVIAQLAERPPAVIFVTAHDAHAVRAFELHAVDYLLKPVQRARFSEALVRTRQRLSSPEQGTDRLAAAIGSIDRGDGPIARFVVKSEGRIRFVRAEDVFYIEAAANYVVLHTERERHMVRETMRSLADQLDPARFLRIHRSYFVNVDAVREIQHLVKGELAVVLHGGKSLPLSRTYRTGLENRLGRLFQDDRP